MDPLLEIVILLFIGVLFFDNYIVIENYLFINKSLGTEINGFSKEELTKSFKETQDKGFYKILENKIGLITLFVTLYFLVPISYDVVKELVPNESSFIQGIVQFLALSIPLYPISLMFTYLNFNVDKKYGHIKISFFKFMKNSLKETIFGIFIGILVFYFFDVSYNYTDNWWLYISGFMAILMIVMNILSPYLASFLDAKTEEFTGEYAEEVKKELAKKGIKSENIRYAKKSEKDERPNAYVAGSFGTLKIVLYDTLTNLLTPMESVAVIGHELGHKEHKHNLIGSLFGFLIIGGMFFIMGNIPNEWFQYFNIEKNSMMILFIGSLVLSPYMFIMGFFQNLLSRKNEFQADDYGVEMTSKEDMKNALIKIYKKSNSYPIVSKLYGLKNLSHPTLLERIKNIEKES